MSTEKQIAANRLNAKSSTGPRTEHGKRRSRRNAFRHGLTAETVIDVLEDQADYKALASRIKADYRPRSNFELELVARLVSLLVAAAPRRRNRKWIVRYSSTGFAEARCECTAR